MRVHRIKSYGLFTLMDAMYSLTPMVDAQPNFVIFILFMIFVFSLYFLSSCVAEEAHLVKRHFIVLCVFIIITISLFIYFDNSRRSYKNEEIIGIKQNQNLLESSGIKTSKTRPIVVYRVPEGDIVFEAGYGVAYPEIAIIYKN